jgi:hypothetical protein
MSNLYYQSCDKQNHDRINGNRKLYIVKRYCRKYPDDPGGQPINDDDVVRPANHLWANHEESQIWRNTITRKSNTHSTAYGLCCNCYTSGLNNMGCLDGCGTSMDAELENTRPFNTAITPLIVRQLLKIWASTIPRQWQVESRSGLEPHVTGSTFK